MTLEVGKVRLDKWLWSVRIFKSRSIASQACRDNKIRTNNKVAKSSTMVSVDDIILLRKDHFNLRIKVVKLIEKRVGAPLAVECYINETTQEELNKFKVWYTGLNAELRAKGSGRPTKKDRREIDQYKEDPLIDFSDWEMID